MPTYQSFCLTCGAEHEYIATVKACHDTPVCCGQKTEKRIFSPPMGQVDIPAYESPASGKWITSRAERREDFKRTGCRPWEGRDQEVKERARQMKYDEVKQDAALEHTIRKTISELPKSKKDQLLSA
jgi:hypothetical protein